MKETTGRFAHLKIIHSDLHPCTQKDTTFILIASIVLLLVSIECSRQHPPDTNEHKAICFLSAGSDAVFFCSALLLLLSSEKTYSLILPVTRDC